VCVGMTEDEAQRSRWTFYEVVKDIREDAAYGDFVEITEEDAQTQLERAKKFVKEAEVTMQKMIQEAENG